MKSFIKSHSYEYLLTLLLTTCASLVFDVNFGLNVGTIFCLIISILLSAVVITFHAFRKKPLPYIIVGILIIITIIIFANSTLTLAQLYDNYMTWWFDGRFLEEKNIYAFLLETAFALGFAILVFFLQLRQKTRIFSSIIAFSFLIYLGFIEYKMPRLAAVTLACYIVAIVVEIINSRNKTHQTTMRIMNHMYPVIIAFVLISSIIPSSDKPFEWKIVKSIWNGITETVSDIIDEISDWFSNKPLEFGMSFSGYSEDASISGNVESSPELALSLANKLTVNTGVYLIGNTKNVYTGHGWENDTNVPESIASFDERDLDMLEFLYALYYTDNIDNYADYCLPREFVVTYDSIKTTSLFYPNKLRRLTVGDPSVLERSISSIKFPKKAGKDTRYQISYYELNLGSPQLTELIETMQEDKKLHNTYIPMQKFLNRIKPRMVPLSVSASDNLTDILRDRKDYIYEAYGSVPELASTRTIELANEITKDCTNSYQKARVIENFLKANYPYTTSPGPIPDEYDCVDYFLFENKQGYCTYFASAFCVMCRSVGIPTRFVQGFCADGTTLGRHNTFNIYNSNAHAWAECYIDGIGWISFEPTPGYDGYRYNPWAATNKEEIDEADKYHTELIIPTPSPVPETEENLEFVEERESISSSFIVALVIIFASCVLGLILYIIIKYLIEKRNYKKLSIYDKILFDYRLIFTYASFFGIDYNHSDTFRVNLANLLEEINLKADANQIITSFEKIRYTTSNNEHLASAHYYDVQLIKSEVLRVLKFRRHDVFYYYIKIKVMLFRGKYIG